jgi:hypothetical protein
MPVRTLTKTLGAALALAAVANAPLQAQISHPLTVGLLRSDGVVLPFAHWGGVHWTTLPPDEIPGPALHIDRWYLSTRGGGFRVLKAGSIVKFSDGDNFYEEWGQITDFAPRHFEVRSFPRPRVGVVLSRPERVVHLRPVPQGDPVARRITALVRSELDRQDSATTRRVMSGNTLSAAERMRLPVRIVTLDASAERVGGERIYFYIAERQYPGCESGALEGLAVESKGAVRLVSPRFQLGDCEGKGRTTLRLDAIVPLREGVFLIGEASEWEGATRVVLELTASGVRGVVPAR